MEVIRLYVNYKGLPLGQWPSWNVHFRLSGPPCFWLVDSSHRHQPCHSKPRHMNGTWTQHQDVCHWISGSELTPIHLVREISSIFCQLQVIVIEIVIIIDTWKHVHPSGLLSCKLSLRSNSSHIRGRRYSCRPDDVVSATNVECYVTLLKRSGHSTQNTSSLVFNRTSGRHVIILPKLDFAFHTKCFLFRMTKH